MSCPPQLKSLVDALPSLSGPAFASMLCVAAANVAGTDPSAGIVAAFKDSMIESGLEDGSHEGAVGAAAFLFRQASKIPVAKLAPRLKPLGFSDEHLAVLADGLVAHNEGLQPSGDAGTPLSSGAEEASGQVTTEELEKMAADLIADSDDSDVDGDDYDSGDGGDDDHDGVVGAADDSANGDVESAEPDFPDQDHAQAILTVRHKSMAIFVRAAVAHLVQQNLSKSEIDRIESVAHKSRISLATMRRMLRLTKDILQQSLAATAPDDVLAAHLLRDAQDKLFAEAEPEPELVADSATPLEGTPPVAPDDAQARIILQALSGISTNTAKLFSDAVQQLRQIMEADEKHNGKHDQKEEDDDDSDQTHHKGWLLVETGIDRDISKRTWQKRWLVISPGKLELYFSPDAVTQEDRICLMPLNSVYIQSQPKTPRESAPHSFRLGVKDVTRVEGEAVSKLVIDPGTDVNKRKWMKMLLRAKMQDTDMTGPMGCEIAKRKKWRHFVQRWFVVGPGRLEMYANEASVNLDDFISIVPLESCEILDNPKKKRSDAPLSFRINVNNSAQAKVLGRPVLKLVLNPPDQDSKQKWLQALRLCSLTGIPDEVLERTLYEESSSEESDYDSVDSDGDDEEMDTPFDACGRPRGDAFFGKPLGWTGDVSSDSAEDGESDDQESDEEDEEESGEESAGDSADEDDTAARVLLEGMLSADVTGKQKKWTKRYQRWFVVSVGSLAMYHSADQKTDEERISLIPLSMCQIRSPKTKRKDQPFAFRVDVANWRKVVGEPVSKLILDPKTSEQHEIWMNLLSLAADPAEPRHELALPEAIDTNVVIKSAKEFDALQLVAAMRQDGAVVHLDGEADTEVEVVLRSTACGLATLDGNDKSLLEFHPNKSIVSIKESTTRDGKLKTCEVKVLPSRAARQSAESTLVFCMKDPKALITVMNTYQESYAHADVCTDPVVVSYFEKHSDSRRCAYLQGRLEKHSLVPVDARKKFAVRRPGQAQKAWFSHMSCANEGVVSWFDMESAGSDTGGSTMMLQGSIPIRSITAINWPVFGEGHDRLCCFQIATEDDTHLFAAPNKKQARAWVWALRKLSPMTV